MESYIVTTRNQRINRKYFHQKVLPVMDELRSSTSPVRKIYEIAGKTVCLQFYSEKLLEKMFQTFAHLEKDTQAAPDLTVCIWDSVCTGTHLEPPKMDDPEYTYPREVNAQTVNTDSFLGIYLRNEGTLHLYDEQTQIAYFWIMDARTLPYRLSASPLRLILNWFLSEESTHLLHGAAVSLNGKSVLITAKGGTGKSTTALSCFFAGMSYLGDDYVTVKFGDVITTHSIYNSARLFPQSFDHIFPELKDSIWNKNGVDQDDEKEMVFMSERFPQRVIREAPLRAIMIPVIKYAEKTRIVPTGKIQTMISMIPATLFQLSLLKSNRVSELKSVVERTPCYVAELGTDIKEVGKTIKAFLENES